MAAIYVNVLCLSSEVFFLFRRIPDQPPYEPFWQAFFKDFIVHLLYVAEFVFI